MKLTKFSGQSFLVISPLIHPGELKASEPGWISIIALFLKLEVRGTLHPEDSVQHDKGKAIIYLQAQMSLWHENAWGPNYQSRGLLTCGRLGQFGFEPPAGFKGAELLAKRMVASKIGTTVLRG
jgi:hypothetical protein